jgi:hypothetical protein
MDPAYDAIYVPTSVAEALFSSVPSAQRDDVDTTRWVSPATTRYESGTIVCADAACRTVVAQVRSG